MMVSYGKMSAQVYHAKRACGDRVEIGKGITATIEEIIWARGMVAPFYLVEYWHEGQLISRRLHEEDCR